MASDEIDEVLPPLYLNQDDARRYIAVNGQMHGFSALASYDWDITDGLEAGSVVVARAQGLQNATGKFKGLWYYSFSMLFQDERFNGSSLEIKGSWDGSSPSFEWAIVGGTGSFSLARGVVYGRKMITGNYVKLVPHVFYRPLIKPNMDD